MADIETICQKNLIRTIQAQVQRLLTLGTLKKSQLSLWVSWPILTLLSLSTSLAGLTVFAYYKDCDPVAEGRILKGDQG